MDTFCNNTTRIRVTHRLWTVTVILLSMGITSCNSLTDAPVIMPILEYSITDMGKGTDAMLGGGHLDNSIGISCILEAKDGHIVVTGDKGALQEYNRKGELIRIYDAPRISVSDRVHADVPPSDSAMKGLTQAARAAFYYGAVYQYKVFDGSNAVVETKDGHIIVAGVSGGLQEFNRQGSLIRDTAMNTPVGTSFIRDIIETRSGNMVTASIGGVREYDREGNVVRNFDFLGLAEVTAVIETRNGNFIAAGTQRRMYEFNRHDGLLHGFNTDTSVLIHVSKIVEASDGNIIVASEGSPLHLYSVLEEYDRKGNVVQRYNARHLADAHALIETKDHNIIIGGKGEELLIRKGESYYYSVSEYDRKGRLVCNYLAPGLYIVRSVIETRDGNVIVAGQKRIREAGGLYRVPCMYEFAGLRSK